MKSLTKIKSSLALGLATLNLFIFSPAALAAAPPATNPIQNEIESGVNSAAGSSGAGANATGQVNNTIASVVNVLSTIVGIIAVIMLIIAGFRYVTSGGNSDKITSAKNTMVYAIIGLIIVALAQIIVRFVLNKVTKP